MIILDYILRFIWAIITLGIVGLIIYSRKSLISILHALGDMDLLKAGPLEFKRRQQQELNKILSVQPDKKSDAESESEKTPEQMILDLKMQLLVATSLAYFLSTIAGGIELRQVKNAKDIRDDVYNDLISSCPNSYAIDYSKKIDSFVEE